MQSFDLNKHILLDACLRLKLSLHWQDRISLFNWLFFLTKCALHFATKLNSWDIQKCKLFLGTLLWCQWNLYNLSYQAEEKDVPRVHPNLRVEFTGWKNKFALNLLMCKSVWTKGDLRKGAKCRICKPLHTGVQMGVQTRHLPLLRIFYS